MKIFPGTLRGIYRAALLRMPFLIIPLFTAVGPDQALAQMSTEEQGFWRKNLVGWKGLAARCVGDSNHHIEKVCRSVVSEFKSLSQVKDISFIYTGLNVEPFHHYMKATDAGLADALNITIYIRTTEGSPLSIYGRISAGHFYSNAIEKDAEQDEPSYAPKSGEFVIWDRDVIGMGRPDELARAISGALKEQVRLFFSEYLIFGNLD